ncbi:lysophospholipid acyltransferase family protein [Arthrobacter psychrochitiniphilus]|uniref:1-acyl-sn-glycerol-3-phosphate acyltransferase n=1 Tax=Arthrobacter psychrochitiniphilus TaxID=291045 RepID=A0A2V3DQY5_9MICC|nr:lysophospholipid acyltransferase family protein [Arthrobacter psychrochitiniphilus]NYG17319.1 1-acyl-sn-glycerol-3-phosphate acyltransferase [Arthrobacter psychrochitiniphilus]PXA65419.1 1-acyl-sn-glycerol-3-phosphate acyltransferase [Arthrobacter psychrochitiniphilus]
MIYWVLKKIFLGPVLKVLFRPWTKGLDNLPVDGPAVLASNHLSFSDSIFMPLMVPRPVVFLAKSDYFTGRGIKGRLTAAFFKLTNQLPMDRSGGAASANSLGTGVEVLNDGGLLGIYPEGTRSPDGRLYRGKVGVAKLVLTANVPVIPVAMIGTDKVQPIGRRIPTVRRLGVIFGEPMDFSRYQGMADDRFVQRSVTDEIMYELMRLSGQEYVDSYASTVKDKIAAEKSAKIASAKEALSKDPAGTKSATDAVRLDPVRTLAPGAVTVIGAKKPVQEQMPVQDQGSESPKVEPGETAGLETGSQASPESGPEAR